MFFGCGNPGVGFMAKRNRDINLPAPYLRRVWIDPARVPDREAYPFCLPFLGDDFEVGFERAVTIIVGENGTGKSTLLEGIAALAGYDGAGGGMGYKTVDHSDALEVMGGELSDALRASWLPKITNGWFFRAESFFSVARYLDKAAKDDPFGGPPPDFLSHSHGEGFLRFFEERCQRQGIFIFDEPESAPVALASDRISEAAADDGQLRALPGHYGHAFANANGLSQRHATAADEIWVGADDGRADRSLQGAAGVLRRPSRVCGGGD
jgi:predicted ATPase